MADTAALVVALSAQLTKFEKDMKDAVTIADRRTKEIETSFSKLNDTINSQLSSLAQAYSSNIGRLGSLLGALGPYGTAAAVGLGAAVLAMNQLIETADRYSEKQKKLREASETTGLSINQFKVLSRAAAAAGVDADQFETAINKMNAAIEELQKNAEGKLFDALRKYPEILTQISNAKDPAQAIEILATAFAGLDSQFKKSEFLKVVFGRGGFDVGRVLTTIFDAGGLKNMMQAAKDANKEIDEGLNKTIVDLKIKIDAAKKAQEEFIGKMVTKETQEAQLQYLGFWNDVIKLIDDANRKMQQGQAALPAFLRALRNRTFGDTSGLSGITTGPTLEQAGKTTAEAQAAAAAQFPGGAPLPTPRPAAATPTPQPTLEQRIRDINDMISALGGAARQTELLTQRQLELDKLLKENKITQDTYNRALAETKFQQAQLAESVRERLGVANEEQIITGKLNDIREQERKGIITSTEAIKAQTIARKEGTEAAEAQQVRLSRLPELTKFGQDAAKPLKQLDQFATTTFTNFENALADVATGTTKLSAAFTNMANSIIRDLVRIALRMSITGPLSSALSGLFPVAGTGPTAAFPEGLNSPGVTAPLSSGVFLPRQGGGPVSKGRGYIVGEHGTELFVPNASGNIIPHLEQKSSGGQTVVEVNNYVAADTETRQTSNQQGPDAERIVIDIVKKAQARGELDDTNRGRFGLRPNKVR